jgi:hypothetical protein
VPTAVAAPVDTVREVEHVGMQEPEEKVPVTPVGRPATENVTV